MNQTEIKMKSLAKSIMTEDEIIKYNYEQKQEREANKELKKEQKEKEYKKIKEDKYRCKEMKSRKDIHSRIIVKKLMSEYELTSHHISNIVGVSSSRVRHYLEDPKIPKDHLALLKEKFPKFFSQQTIIEEE